ncbi:PilZ domain-containing protein [Allopontixanthobacter sediminis]|uniref:PilZ domain-containing protein n=1 Tax=Allopontixanthobacter sediminis TaxID=1689985 RepID=A0A845B2D4_9SPHN|nr:PilZ domain-containing protein [Allopontixanthobacter sediminis]MXP44745.1 PilZ domain-containing protein [Allopontixanthobacter sediminis]
MSSVDTRNIARDSLFLLAEMRLAGIATEFRVKVRNLSAGGMMAEGNVPVVPGNRLKVHLRNVGWIDGGVAWVQDNRFGIAFDNEINHKLARAPADSGQPASSAQQQFLRSTSGKSDTGADQPDKFRTI